MRLLLDEPVPRRLGTAFPAAYEVRTVPGMGWAGTGNGALLRLAADRGFDAPVTVDRGIAHEQTLDELPVPGVIMLAVRNRLDDLRRSSRRLSTSCRARWTSASTTFRPHDRYARRLGREHAGRDVGDGCRGAPAPLPRDVGATVAGFHAVGVDVRQDEFAPRASVHSAAPSRKFERNPCGTAPMFQIAHEQRAGASEPPCSSAARRRSPRRRGCRCAGAARWPTP